MKIKFFINFCIIYVLFCGQAFANILFSEIFPNTEDDKNLEYIELYNSGETELSLSGYVLKDKIGKEYIFSDSQILLAGEKKKYLRPETKITLNNSDEELFLNDDLGNLVDSFSYSVSVKGEVIKIPLSGILSPSQEKEATSTGNIDITVPDILYSFQNRTYLLDKEKILGTYYCDSSKEECKINLDLRNSFTGSFSENDFICETDFGFLNEEEDKCNPATIIVPVGTYDFNFKIVRKNFSSFSEKNIKIINSGYIKPESNTKKKSSTKIINMGIDPVVIAKPDIIVQSGVNEKNECSNRNNCNLNFRYSEKSKFEKCHWEFPGGTFEPGTNNKCDPGYVKYGTGEFVVNLRVYEDGDYYNFNESKFVFWNGVESPHPNQQEQPHPNPLLRGEGIDGIEIFKVIPNPEGSDNFEFIELKNNTQEKFNLKGCILDDILEGGSKQFIFKEDDYLKSGEVKRYYKELTKLNLNNDSDEVNLICNDKLFDSLKWDFDIKSGYELDHSKLDVTSGKAKVIDVVDGDTIKIQFSGSDKIETLRLIGVDTPETKHPNKEVEKYGLEIYKYVLQELKGREVVIELDEDNLRDYYSRLLGFVYLEQVNFNKKLIELGFSKAYLDYDFKYKADFIEAEKVAKEEEVGIWGSSELLLNFQEQTSSLTYQEQTSPLTPLLRGEGNLDENQLKSKITIQGKIGANKNLNGNVLTCYDTCSVNFDGSESNGNIKKYSWDFGNGEKYDGPNPGYIKYETLGNYKVYLATISDKGELDIQEFYVNFYKTPKKQKVTIIGNANAEDDISDQTESQENINDTENTEDESNYLFIFYIIIGVFGTILLFVILRKEELV